MAFAAGLQMQSDQQVKAPTAAKTYSRGTSIENLDSVELADHGNLVHPKRESDIGTSRKSPSEAHRSGNEASRDASVLEASPPASPRRSRVTPALPSFRYPTMNRWRVLSACLQLFGNGLSDSAPGALIPYVETFYGIGYAIVSLIWIANAAGFIFAAFVTDLILSRLGRSKTHMLSEAFMASAYVVIASTPPFPVIVVAYFLMGFGNAINLALNNVFLANMADSTVILGIAQGSYGIGGIVAPIAATAMVSAGILWSRFYTIAIATRVVCFFFAGWAYRGYEKEPTSEFSNTLQQVPGRQAATDGQTSKLRMLAHAINSRVTLIGALFIFAYQGAEVSESGWFISYLISYRGGDPARVGYVTSGFWAGITVGRFILTYLASRMGEKLFVFAMGVGAIVFQLMSWLIPNIIGNAVSVAILGLLLGPVYPAATTVFMKLLPSNLQTMSISFIASAGSSGGAVVPFLTGLAAQSIATWVLHPICVGAFVLMLACWICLPRIRKPTD